MIEFVDVKHSHVLAKLHALCFERPWKETAFQTLLDMKSVFAYGFDDGFILCRVVLDEAEVLTICVLPRVRNKGFAKDMMQYTINRLCIMEVNVLHLEVSEKNTVALKFYESCGFLISGRRYAYYGRDDALLMKYSIE